MSILKHLEKYFETTSPEQIRKDWEETSKFDTIGLSVDDFLIIQDRMNGVDASNEKCTLHNVSNNEVEVRSCDNCKNNGNKGVCIDCDDWRNYERTDC